MPTWKKGDRDKAEAEAAYMRSPEFAARLRTKLERAKRRLNRGRRVQLGTVELAPAPPRSLEDAERVAREAGLSGLARTGLRKACPRCGREGWVFGDGGSFAIVWDGPARVPAALLVGATVDVDTLVSLRDLALPEFGCGYDPALRRGRRSAAAASRPSRGGAPPRSR